MTKFNSRFCQSCFWALGIALSLGLATFNGYQLAHFLNGEPVIRQFRGPIKIAIIDWAGYYPIAVAKELGLYQRAGLDVEILLAPNLTDLNDWVRTGKVQGASGVLADFYLLRDLEVPIQMIMATDYSLGDTILAGNQIRTPRDLLGKRIGIAEMNSWAEYFVFKLLTSAGIDPDQVQFRTYAADRIPKAILDGEIDAGHTWDPVLSVGLRSGLHSVLSSKLQPQLVISGLVVRENILNGSSRPNVSTQDREFGNEHGVAVSLVRAVLAAQKIAIEDPARFAQHAQRFLRANKAEWSEVSIVESLKSNVDLCDLGKNRQGYSKDGVFRAELTNIAQFFEGHGVTSSKTDASQLLNDAAIRTLANEKVVSD